MTGSRPRSNWQESGPVEMGMALNKYPPVEWSIIWGPLYPGHHRLKRGTARCCRRSLRRSSGGWSNVNAPCDPNGLPSRALRTVAKNRAIIVIAMLVENRVVAQPFVTELRVLSGAEVVGDRETELWSVRPRDQTLQPSGSASSISEGVRPSESSPTAEYER